MEIRTIADVKQVPEDQWIVLHSVGGRCSYCGKVLPVYRDCCVRYGKCDCEVAQAVEEHNRIVLENRKK